MVDPGVTKVLLVSSRLLDDEFISVEIGKTEREAWIRP